MIVYFVVGVKYGRVDVVEYSDVSGQIFCLVTGAAVQHWYGVDIYSEQGQSPENVGLCFGCHPFGIAFL